MTVKEHFLQPKDHYTPFPFWFWNDAFSEEEIKKQMDDFEEKGIKGFVLHPRIGIPKDIPYLGEHFFFYIRYAVELAAEKGMQVILYDEGMYPSGSANGQVVRDHPEYASKGIYVTKAEDFVKRSDRFQDVLFTFKWNEQKEKAIPKEEKHADYYLVHEDSMGTIRGIHFGEDDGEEGTPRSTDLLNSEACQYFITLTHEAYYNELKEYFGKTVVGFFTDEPDILGRNHLSAMLPFNEELAQKLKQKGLEKTDLPKCFLSNKEKKNLKKMYQECVTKQLEKSYYQPISKWCQEHNIFLTGHPHDAHDIALLKYFHVPGQDVVWRWIAPENQLGVKGYESVTAKCSADAARHAENERNANECFGCCGLDENQWSFSADEMKWYLDWLFIRGVNMIIPHAFFYSLKGKRAEDRPPDAGRNNLWWPYYHYFSDYIKRMSYMMSNQINLTNIAVLAEKNHLPFEGIDSFFQNQIEFNYLEDTFLLEGNFTTIDGKLTIAKQSYDMLIVESTYPRSEKIRNILSEFLKHGGQLVILNKGENMSTLLPQIKTSYNRSISLNGNNLNDLRYTEFIKEGKVFYGLSNEGEKKQQLTITFSGSFEDQIEVWDSWKGEIRTVKIDPKSKECKLSIPRRTVYFLTQPDKENIICRPIRNEEPAEKVFTVPYSITTSNPLVKELGSWTENKELRYFSGTVTYTLHIEKEELHKEDLPDQFIIDLGEVKNIATILIDGEERNTIFWSPYTFLLSKNELLESEIKIAVTNTLSNSKDRQELPSGLIGPITFNPFLVE